MTIFLLTACATDAPAPKTPAPAAEKMELQPVPFDDLPGWAQDNQSAALPAVIASCRELVHKPAGVSMIGSATDWQPICTAAAAVPPQDDAAARVFFTQWFQPYAVSDNRNGAGLFTGYYEPELRGSHSQAGPYQTPLYARPADLVTADLGLFLPDLKGKHITGKVDGGKLVLYDNRAQIAQGSLNGRAEVLAYVDDPVSAFFLEVQGSGRVRLDDGATLRLGFDASNGRHYTALGGALQARGDIDKPVTMPKIRDWLDAHPDQRQAALDLNASYIFFRPLDSNDETAGPIGAEGVALTPQRSLAVDPAYLPLGAPVWLDTTDGAGAAFRHLMVAQDTGGAIKGVVRGDVFWGFGSDAAAQAGSMQGHGRYYLLLPKSVTAHVS